MMSPALPLQLSSAHSVQQGRQLGALNALRLSSSVGVMHACLAQDAAQIRRIIREGFLLDESCVACALVCCSKTIAQPSSSSICSDAGSEGVAMRSARQSKPRNPRCDLSLEQQPRVSAREGWRRKDTTSHSSHVGGHGSLVASALIRRIGLPRTHVIVLVVCN